jgi:hypothetical protein
VLKIKGPLPADLNGCNQAPPGREGNSSEIPKVI